MYIQIHKLKTFIPVKMIFCLSFFLKISFCISFLCSFPYISFSSYLFPLCFYFAFFSIFFRKYPLNLLNTNEFSKFNIQISMSGNVIVWVQGKWISNRPRFFVQPTLNGLKRSVMNERIRTPFERIYLTYVQ